KGTVYLDEVSRNEKLDFLVLYSSLSSIVGNRGQTDYSYANSFMDYYGEWRSAQKATGKTVVINWPFWKNGGMKLEPFTENFFSTTLGLCALEDNEGMLLLEQALRGSEVQYIPIKGDKIKLLDRMIEKKGREQTYTKKDSNTTIEAENQKRLFHRVNKELITIIHEILRTDKNKINLDAELSSFGFDSISFTRFSNELNKRYDLDVMPSLFFEYPTLRSLSTYFADRHAEVLNSYYGFERDTEVTKRAPQQYSVNSQNVVRKESKLYQVDERSKEAYEPIAVIGMSGIMPQSEDLEEFWEHLKAKEHLVTEVPLDRWDWREYYGDPKEEANQTYAKFGGFMKEVDKFDPLFFGISPKEAELMDPQQRLFMLMVWQAIENAGYKPSDLSGTRTSLFVGVATQDYNEILKEKTPFLQPQSLTGMTHSVLANRISFLLNILGPSQPVDTACSSSLIAIHQAIESIHHSGCEMAIAGGVNVMLTPTLHISESKAGMLSSDGKCKTFDDRADGYVRGEGVGVILLKSLHKAIEDGDYIHGVIKGSSVNHGGRGNSLTSPNPNAQANVLIDTYEKAGFSPDTIGYIEAHGTGTALGDPIEINALKNAFSTLYKKHGLTLTKRKSCKIGSVKSNIGHLETAAGIAGVLKVLLSLKHRTIPASLHVENVNPYIRLEDTPFEISTETTSWESIEKKQGERIPLRAGVSSFGFGGANAHLAIEEHIQPEVSGASAFNSEQIVILSAKSESGLKKYASRLIDYIQKEKMKTDTFEPTRNTEIYDFLIEACSQLLSIDPTEISLNETFEENGLDSFHLSRLTDAINDHFKVDIQGFETLNCGNLQQLTELLIKAMKEALNSQRHSVTPVKQNLLERDFSLKDAAYTLQVGREEMDERLAIVATDWSQLNNILLAYTEDREHENLYTGNSRSASELALMLTDGLEGEEFLRTIVKGHKYGKLAQLWVSGSSIDWKVLHKEGGSRRIPLPTYPFAQKRYWIPEFAKHLKTQQKLDAGYQERLHPMLERNISTLEETLFSTTLRLDDFYIRDHVIKGQMMLPGVAYLEMARSAGEIASGKKVFSLRNVVWASPILLTQPEVHVRIKLEKNTIQNEIIEFQILGENNKVHANGKLVFEPLGDSFENFDLESIKNRLSTSIQSSEHYRTFSEIDFEYGKTMQPVQQILGSEREALSILKLPEKLEDKFYDYGLHPSLLDGALQTVKGIGNSNGTSEAFLPFSVASVDCFLPLTTSCYVYAIQNTKTDSQQGIKKFTIVIMDKNGEVAVKFNDFTVRATRPITKAPLPNDKLSTVFFKQSWVNKVLPQNDIFISKVEQSVLVWVPNLEFIETYCRELDPEKTTYVLPGSGFGFLGENLYEINPTDPEDYRRLLLELKRENKSYLHSIHLWTCGLLQKHTSLEMKLENGVYALFYWQQLLLQENKKGNSKLIYAFIEDNYVTEPAYAAIYSYLKTLKNEMDGFSFKTVQLRHSDQDNKKFTVRVLLEELNSIADENSAIFYSEDVRFVQENKVDESTLSSLKPSMFKDKGVYLIAGGAGGIGLILSEYLVSKYQVNIILSGRSDLSVEKKLQMQRMNKTGSEVTYIKADLTILDDVTHLVDSIKSKYGYIDGVIQTAGSNLDKLAILKNKEQMELVFGSKVSGTYHLDEVLANENLDFFALFSSMAAIVGNPGQSDYAFANSYVDHFAVYRNELKKQGLRKGASLSINWPLWADGGMGIDSRHQLQKLEEAGIVPLPSIEGINILEQMLISGAQRSIPVYGEREKIVPVIVLKQPEYIKPESSNTSFVENVIPQSAEEFEIEISEICSQMLKIDIGDLDREERLMDYGVDSITMIALLAKLESHYGETMDPNLIIEYPSIREIARHLSKTIKGTVKPQQHHDLIKHVDQEKDFMFLENKDLNKAKDSTYSIDMSDKTIDPAVDKQKVAVISMSCRFPGSESIEQYWDNLREAKDSITEVPSDRWDVESYFDTDKSKAGKSYSKWGGFIKDPFAFSPMRFGIDPKDAVTMDPQHRIMLELANELWTRAGYKKEEVDGSNTGVILGGGASSYVKISESNLPEEYQKHIVVNSIPNMMAARISDYYNLTGVSQTIDTACSSALVAIHQACQHIIHGELDMAIAGGIELLLDSSVFVGYSKAEVLSDDGKCYVFDERAKGFVLGEGGGLVLLKSYEKALTDGDDILGVISASAVNNDGHTMGLTIPNLERQKDVIRKALIKSGISPKEINYLEAHGTGTLLGDPIEIKAATQVYQEFTSETQFCAVGSVKSNIGHLARAAGVASFIKVILAISNKEIPPTLHCHSPHPRFKFEDSPFYPIQTLKPWKSTHAKRTAAISSFGFGGTNCHMIVESGPDTYKGNREKQSIVQGEYERTTYRWGSNDSLSGPDRKHATEQIRLDTHKLQSMSTLLDDIENGRISVDQAYDQMIKEDIVDGSEKYEDGH
ncbi:SDR family NAD(P)-dependent oxidoreductase, partial [Saccharibacillus sacchari]